MKANLRIVVLAVAVAAACTDAFAQFGVNIGYMKLYIVSGRRPKRNERAGA